MSTHPLANRFVKFSGLLGTIVFLFGMLGALAVGSFTANFIVTLHLVLGAALIILWTVTVGLKHETTPGELLTGRLARFSYNAIAYVGVFIAIVVIINYLAYRYDKRWDLT